MTASEEGVEIAEKALIRLGFESKSNFAKSQLISRTVVTKFFNYQPIQLDTFKRICDALKLNWREVAALEEEQPKQVKRQDCSSLETQEDVGSMQTRNRHVTVVEKSNQTVKAEIILKGDINSVEHLKTLELILRQYSGHTITIKDIQKGSIKLKIEGSQEDINRLIERIQSGELTEVNGFPIEDIKILSESSDDEESNESVDKWRLVQEIVSQPVKKRNLIGVDLSDVDLSRADRSTTILNEATLRESNLSGADLIVANLNLANLIGANLNVAHLDPQRSSLATWTNQPVKFNSELNEFLLQRGIYLVSNWAILNDTRPKQLERILSEFYKLTPLEVKKNQQLLACYHRVYRTQRQSQRQTGFRRRCQPPTPEQYQQMAQMLATQWNQPLSPETVDLQLQELATRLRDYRIFERGGQVPTSMIDSAQSEQSEQISAPGFSEDSQTEISEFLKVYHQQFLASLDAALAQVINQRLKLLKRQGSDKSEQFLRAIHLFYCQGQSMGEITNKLGFKAQYQVTRLLRLKEFRADVRQTLFIELCDRIRELANNYTDSQRLQTLDQQIDQVLDKQTSQIIQEAERESDIAQNRPKTSLFSKRLCRYIDTLIQSKNQS